jgi:hypothetical protein
VVGDRGRVAPASTTEPLTTADRASFPPLIGLVEIPPPLIELVEILTWFRQATAEVDSVQHVGFVMPTRAWLGGGYEPAQATRKDSR